jgi:hypothetical protein
MEVAELELFTRETYDGYIRRTILPALGSMPLRKLRGPVLDTFYARLRRCADLTCTGRPFTEHRKFPAISIETDASRPAWHQVADALRSAMAAGLLSAGDQLPSVRELAAGRGSGQRRCSKRWPCSPTRVSSPSGRDGEPSFPASHAGRSRNASGKATQGTTASVPGACRTSAGQCRLGQVARSTRSSLAHSRLRCAGSGSTGAQSAPRGCPRPGPVPRPPPPRPLSPP